jgi:DNA polymerase-3 subunit delta
MTAFVNIISSDEPLLLQEACDVIISSARQAGVAEREVVDVVDKFCWNDVMASNQSLSLFAEVKLTDIRFTKMPKKDAQQALTELLQNADAENQFLIRLPKLEKRQKNAKWFKAVCKGARFQELWPPKPYEFSNWISARAAREAVNLSPDSVAMLAEHTEGNLLAASQTIEKLKLLHKDQPIDLDRLREVVSDNARYSVFLCLDEALAGKGSRAVKMLHKFKQEDIAPISILVNLTREIGYCNQVSMAVYQGQSANQALASTYLWDSKKRMIIAAAGRLPWVIWQKLLQRCALRDRMVKGLEKGNIWQELESCLWLLSGKKIWGAKR